MALATVAMESIEALLKVGCLCASQSCRSERGFKTSTPFFAFEFWEMQKGIRKEEGGKLKAVSCQPPLPSSSFSSFSTAGFHRQEIPLKTSSFLLRLKRANLKEMEEEKTDLSKKRRKRREAKRVNKSQHASENKI